MTPPPPPSPLVYETHMHTPLCRHALGDPGEYAAVAERKGLKGIIVTCHAPLPEGYSPMVRMTPEEWPAYVGLVAAAREEWAGRVDIRLGLESDFMPGLEPWLEELHAREPLNYVLGSVHPQTPEYQDRYLGPDPVAFHRQYFESLAEAAETGLFDCLSHPDLVKNYGSYAWDPEALILHIRRCLDRVAATGTAMELNTSGLLKTVPEMNPGPGILREMRQCGIPVVVGADAHHPDRVADHFPEAYDLLERAGYDTVRIYLDRRPRDIPIADARASLKV